MNIDDFKLAAQRFVKNDLSAYTTADKREVLGTVIGYLVAMNLPLPTTPVTETVNYYVVTHEPVAARVFDQINESEFLDTTMAREVARNIYLLRYNMVYSPEVMISLTPSILASGVASLPSKVSAVINKVGVESLANINKYYF